MKNEHLEMMESAEPTSKKVLTESQKQNEKLNTVIQLLGTLCSIESDRLDADSVHRNDWYESKLKQEKTSKKTLFFSAIAVLIGCAAIGVELQFKFNWVDVAVKILGV